MEVATTTSRMTTAMMSLTTMMDDDDNDDVSTTMMDVDGRPATGRKLVSAAPPVRGNNQLMVIIEG